MIVSDAGLTGIKYYIQWLIELVGLGLRQGVGGKRVRN
jgi:hypothetical protein